MIFRLANLPLPVLLVAIAALAAVPLAVDLTEDGRAHVDAGVTGAVTPAPASDRGAPERRQEGENVPAAPAAVTVIPRVPAGGGGETPGAGVPPRRTEGIATYVPFRFEAGPALQTGRPLAASRPAGVEADRATGLEPTAAAGIGAGTAAPAAEGEGRSQPAGQGAADVVRVGGLNTADPAAVSERAAPPPVATAQPAVPPATRTLPPDVPAPTSTAAPALAQAAPRVIDTAPRPSRNVTPPGFTPAPTVDGPLVRLPDVAPPPIAPRWRRFFLPATTDAATFVVGDRIIKVAEVAPPPADLTCPGRDGTPWPCGRAALTGLRLFLRGRAVECFFASDNLANPLVVPCRVGRTDIAVWLAGQGWAEPAADAAAAIRTAAAAARCSGKGVWRGRPDPAACPPAAAPPTPSPAPPVVATLPPG